MTVVTSPWSLLLAAVGAYLVSALVTYLLVVALHRTRRIRDMSAGLVVASVGGAFGSVCAIVIGAADGLDLLGL
jgi:hypothetical protein